MFSTFTSFLPSALQGDHGKPTVESPTEDDVKGRDRADTDRSDTTGVDETGAKKKTKKDRTNETFIVVRPPPAKSNHPLNLQVQLVPPSARGTAQERSLTGRQSVDFSAAPPTEGTGAPDPSADTSDANLSRVNSRTSGYSSVASFSSVSSNSTTGRRMIVPLYNLQAHNVMTNLVVDAGTDSKVAKFLKRGIELIDLAVLEPIEVWPRRGGELSTKPTLLLPPTHNSRPVTPEQALTPSSSAFSLSSAGHIPRPTTAPAEATPTPPSGAKKVFGKLFRKKDAHTRNPSLTSSANSESPRPSSIASPRFSVHMPTSPVAPNTPTVEHPSAAEQNLLRPAVLGVQPTFSSPVQPPVGRPTKYVWIVRRWIKGADNGVLGSVMGKLNVNVHGKDSSSTGLTELVEVRFEWSRGKSKSGRERGRAGRRESVKLQAPSAEGSRRASMTESLSASASSLKHLAQPSAGSPHASPRSKRLSTLSHHSISTANDHDHDHDEASDELDDGEESDPEDSETPWTCSLRMSRVNSASTPPVKTKVATLSPTPHHPKVVALLKVPFPLPDIAVDRLAIERRVVTPQGLLVRPSTAGADRGLILTAEEIKDIVSTTGLWLVVREGFGGVGKVSRKGDGWRIRG
ncbi:hypothetical protein PLICRDRAFT_138582 [Plicaturopsis crispa FD-325 SS-3]|nr:hypothetical protein PLICRDRAFT_138582 [Plicaturopsis crispa FD-325 SS-3]